MHMPDNRKVVNTTWEARRHAVHPCSCGAVGRGRTNGSQRTRAVTNARYLSAQQWAKPAADDDIERNIRKECCMRSEKGRDAVAAGSTNCARLVCGPLPSPGPPAPGLTCAAAAGSGPGVPHRRAAAQPPLVWAPRTTSAGTRSSSGCGRGGAGPAAVTVAQLWVQTQTVAGNMALTMGSRR